LLSWYVEAVFNSGFHFILAKFATPFSQAKPAKFDSLVVSWSARLPFKLGDSGSILARISTQGLKIIEEKELPLH
jgi:hypothetical protein